MTTPCFRLRAAVLIAAGTAVAFLAGTAVPDRVYAQSEEEKKERKDRGRERPPERRQGSPPPPSAKTPDRQAQPPAQQFRKAEPPPQPATPDTERRTRLRKDEPKQDGPSDRGPQLKSADPETERKTRLKKDDPGQDGPRDRGPNIKSADPETERKTQLKKVEPGQDDARDKDKGPAVKSADPPRDGSPRLKAGEPPRDDRPAAKIPDRSPLSKDDPQRDPAARGPLPGAKPVPFDTARPKRFDEVQKGRRERVEDGGRRKVIQEPGNRFIVKQDDKAIIRHDESERFRRRPDAKTVRRADGTNETYYVRKDGTRVVTVVDDRGRLLRRYRRTRDGREFDIIDNRRFYRGIGIGGIVALNLGMPRIGIPRDRYIVDYEHASEDDLYEALIAPPVEDLDRAYALDEIRYNYELRARMRRIDLDTVTFEFGAWEVPPDQYQQLERIARIMLRVLERNSEAVFFIEGHTDAVGPDDDNLSLADRRASSVAEILSDQFGVPPENLVTQGYGEQYLKVDTQGPERLNRRVTILNITRLMAER
jgi:outer membrane protein OmpA-like peptidoglycan-associated protein